MLEQNLAGTLNFLTGLTNIEFLAGLTALCAAGLLLGLGIGKVTNQIRRAMR